MAQVIKSNSKMLYTSLLIEGVRRVQSPQYDQEAQYEDKEEATSIPNHQKGSAMCDVVPMFAGHILLWLPWLYNYYWKYDARVNMYTFKYQGCRLTFKLMQLDLGASNCQHQRQQGVLSTSHTYGLLYKVLHQNEILDEISWAHTQGGWQCRVQE